jgi:hypothetical protein
MPETHAKPEIGYTFREELTWSTGASRKNAESAARPLRPAFA